MKHRIKYMFMIFVLLLVLVSCQRETCDNCIIIPDFDGMTKDEILIELSDDNYPVYFREYETDDLELDGVFKGFLENYEAGDEFSTSSALGIEIYKATTVVVETEYFEVLDLEYNGPYLDGSFENIDYINPRGGYFEVTLVACTDGDTSKFYYPTEVYELIESGAKSTRFLNMDTEETFSGGEEEWGKPASVYTCSLLEEAVSIVLQTDPGDSLLDTYGRLLAWVWVKLPNEEDYKLLNYILVQQGLAQVKYEFGAGETISYGEHTYNEWMHIAEDYAIENELGQWGDLLDYYWDYENNQPNRSLWD